MSHDPDTLIGGLMAVAGSAGLTIQVVTQVASLGVIVLNAILAIGGLYLIYLKLKIARRALRDDRKT